MNIAKLIVIIVATAGLLACSEPKSADFKAPENLAVEVFKSPSCGCCGVWVEHMEDKGFTATVFDTDALDEKKAELGITDDVRSCHTAVTASGYFFEGHVPAKYVKQFLANPPKNAKGLAVPGMPLGSPGMEMGDRFTPYAIVLLKTDGSREVYAQVDSMGDQQ